MRHSTDGILTSHAGSLPRPDELIELNRIRQEGEDPNFDEAAFQTELTAAVRDVVAKQVAAGVTVPGDGEFGKAMGHKVNYGAWWSYSFSRLSGLDPNGPGLYDMPAVKSKPGEIHLTSFADRRDRERFLAAYSDRTSGVAAGRGGITWPRCVGPVAYTGQDAIAADIAHFKAALAAANVDRRLHDLGRPRKCVASRERVLQDGGGVHLGVRRRDARGVSGHHRRRAHPAARRSVRRRGVGSSQPGALRRGLPALRHDRGRSDEPRAPRDAD